jgi:hypothetical protein
MIPDPADGWLADDLQSVHHTGGAMRRCVLLPAAALLVICVVGCQPANKAATAGKAATSSVAAAASVPAPVATTSAGPVASSPPVAVTASSLPTTPPAAGVLAPTTTPTRLAATAGASAVVAELAALPVKGRAPMTGYSRLQFGPAWPTIGGCDERNDTLQRDLTSVLRSGTCEVLSGTVISPYTAATIHFVRGPESALVQIDHVVALGDAWVTGAAYWSRSTREAFANDPIELLAVDAHSNEAKGDADAASWLPPNNGFRCQYVSIQVAVKTKYHLWVTLAEHNTIATTLATCAHTAPATAAPRPSTQAPAAQPVPAPTTAPAAVAPSTPAAPPKSSVTPGAFCAVAGTTGVSKTGKPEVCKTTPTDTRLRWRAT